MGEIGSGLKWEIKGGAIHFTGVPKNSIVGQTIIAYVKKGRTVLKKVWIEGWDGKEEEPKNDKKDTKNILKDLNKDEKQPLKENAKEIKAEKIIEIQKDK